MAKTNEAVFTQNAKAGRQTIANADGTTVKDLISAGADDTKVVAIAITSDDTAAVDVKIIYNDGTNDDVIGIVNVPITSGMAASKPAVNAMNTTDMPFLPKDNAGNTYLTIKTGHKLRVQALATVTSGKTVKVVALAEDF